MGLKLPPYYHPNEFEEVSKILIKYQNEIKFITCINSIVNGLIIDHKNEETRIYPKEGLGGIGGKYAKPTALSNVFNFYKLLPKDFTIIGCGGIYNGTDVFEHILCGASAVQVGTAYLSDPECFSRLSEELKYVMMKKGYEKIDDFKGKLKIRKTE